MKNSPWARFQSRCCTNFFNLSGLLFITVLICPAFAAPLTASEARGKQLYLTGNSPSGKAITARVGQESIELNGSQLPCVNCHGEDGQGRSEGGIVPTNISFEYLSLSYGHKHDNGRKHPAFTAETISTAISNGIDSAGDSLDVAMPRYTLSTADSADLIAYLKRLTTDADAGLTETSIRLGTLLPTQTELGQAINGILSAYFNELNAQGGIYQRKIQLNVAEFTNNQDATLKNTRQLLTTEAVFALIAPFTSNSDAEILLLTEQQGIPQIGAYTLFPEEDISRSQSAFYLLAGLNNEVRAMVDYVVDVLKLKNSRSLVIRPENNQLQNAAVAIEKRSQTRGLGAVTQFTYSANQFQQVLAQLNQQSPEVIYFLGSSDELNSLLPFINAMKSKPYLFVSSSLTTTKLVGDKIFLTTPAQPSEHHANEFFQLITRNHLTTQHLSTQAMAYSAAKLLVEGLQKTGRDLSRKKLMNTLEHLYQFNTGVMPVLSYAPNRHIGSTAVAIIPAPTN